MSLYEFFGTLEVALVFGLVAFGAFLTFRVLDFPDLTVEGSFPLGAAVAALLITKDVNPWLATLAAMVAGYSAGWVTGVLNMRFNILNILAGILVAIALYSINLRVMGGPNLPLLGSSTIFSGLPNFGLPRYIVSPLVVFVIVIICKIALDLFLHTGFGLNMRAAGANPAMAAANGINVGRMKIVGLGIANALTALAGAMFAQIFGAADAHMGIGVIIVGLASVIVGMAVFPTRTIVLATLACLLGTFLYRFAVAFALNADFLGLKASDVQLVTSALVIVVLIVQFPKFGIVKRKPA